VTDNEPTMPSEIDEHLSLFDRFASAAATLVSRAPFFAASVALVVVWLLEGGIRMISGGPAAFLDQTYQLQINTLTTIITFLLVALLQNTQTRADDATQQKLNAIADALGDLMNSIGDRLEDEHLQTDIKELRAAVGLEEREGTTQKK
jgi:low affinity Fe/Cu permease